MEDSIHRLWGNGIVIVRGISQCDRGSGRLMRLPLYARMRGKEIQFTVTMFG